LKDWETRMQLMVKNVDEVSARQKITEESRRQEGKHLADLQGISVPPASAWMK